MKKTMSIKSEHKLNKIKIPIKEVFQRKVNSHTKQKMSRNQFKPFFKDNTTIHHD